MAKKISFVGAPRYLQQGLTPSERKGSTWGLYDVSHGMWKLVKGGFTTKKEAQKYRKRLK